MTNFELGVHIPFIIRAPHIAHSVGKESAVLAEMVDVYPTLAALAGLPDPRTVVGSEGINGTSLLPAIANPANTTIKTAAFSQFAKNNIGTSVDCQFFRNETQIMGYTIRTDEWRYTSWFRFEHRGARGPFGPASGNFFGRVLVGEILGRELYDHRGDTGKYLDWPGENINLVNYSQHAGVVEELHARLLEYIQIK
jgi:iduronate 2-sulfatase